MNSAWLIASIAALAAALIGYLLGTLRAARRAESCAANWKPRVRDSRPKSELRARTAELLAQSEAQVRIAVENASRAGTGCQ